MCRNIRTLFNFEPPATEDEIHASAVQFVRKLSGFNKPSAANQAAFDRRSYGGFRCGPAAARVAAHACNAARSRSRGGEGARPRTGALRRNGVQAPGPGTKQLMITAPR